MSQPGPFRCPYDVRTMAALLREKVPELSWRVGDSEYEGFYALGRTADGVKVKITEEDEGGVFHLGVFFATASRDIAPAERDALRARLCEAVLGALEAQEG